MTIVATTGLMEWTPGNADVGDHTVTVRVADPDGLWVSIPWKGVR